MQRNGRSGVGGSYHRRATGRRDWPKTLTSRRTGVWRAPCSKSLESSITPKRGPPTITDGKVARIVQAVILWAVVVALMFLVLPYLGRG